jgi:SPP1 family predicted phage head-tail adaptor
VEIGSLRHRITIETQSELQNSNNGAVADLWTTYASNLPAAILPVSGREILAAQAGTEGQRYRFVVRYDSTLALVAKMRVSHESKYFNITEVIPDPTLRKFLTLIAEAGVRYTVDTDSEIIIDGGGDGE